MDKYDSLANDFKQKTIELDESKIESSSSCTNDELEARRLIGTVVLNMKFEKADAPKGLKCVWDDAATRDDKQAYWHFSLPHTVKSARVVGVRINNIFYTVKGLDFSKAQAPNDNCDLLVYADNNEIFGLPKFAVHVTNDKIKDEIVIKHEKCNLDVNKLRAELEAKIDSKLKVKKDIKRDYWQLAFNGIMMLSLFAVGFLIAKVQILTSIVSLLK